MKFSTKLTMIFLTSWGVIYPSLPVKADIETTTIKTTTIKSGDPLSNLDSRSTTTTTETNTIVPEEKTVILPTTTTYTIVDPITGAVKGSFDPMHAIVDIKTISPGSIVVDQVTGKILATISPSGQTVDVLTAPALDPLVTAIDNRRVELDQRITSSLSAGTIDTKESAALRAELDKIASRETLAKQNSGRLPYSEALALSLALNNLSDRLVLLAHGPIITPLLGSRIVNTNGDLIIVDPITYRRYQLLQRTDDEYAARRLSAKQVSDLKELLNSIASLDSKYRKNGVLDSSKTEKLSVKLDNVEVRMNRDVATINDKRAKIGIKVQ
jgi:hypothetical protein